MPPTQPVLAVAVAVAFALAFALALAFLVVIPEGDLLLLIVTRAIPHKPKPCHFDRSP